MSTNANIMGTGRSIGFASRLRRHGAMLAEHESYGRNEFLQTLAAFHQNLGIEGRADNPEQQFDENGELVEDVDTRIEWESLACPKCHRSVANTRSLLEHLVESHAKAQDRVWYKDYQVIGKDVKRMLDEAIETQASCSYVKKKFENSNDVLVCPVDSPLFPFLTMRYLLVYFKELPPGVGSGIALKMQIADTSYTVIFVLKQLDVVRRKIKKNCDTKAQQKKLSELEKLCARAWVPEDDVVFKTTRTAEETSALAEALELKAPYTQEDIINKINEMKTKREEINNVYTNTIKSDGQAMTSEEKKLISSLSFSFMVPVDGKRKTTYKNPSELLLVKKKKKTDAPSSQ